MKRLVIVILVFFVLLFLTLPNPSALDLDFTELNTQGYKNSKQLQISQIPILMYHSISDIGGVYSELCVSPSSFSKQMDYLLDSGYSTITFHGLLDYIEGNKPLPEKPIILTFDDGYLDNYKNAFMAMRERAMVGVVYPYINKIGTENGLSKDQLLKMQEQGWEIGSHTITHLDLTSLTDRQLKNEVYESKVKLKEMFDSDVVSVCYPAGRYNDKVVEFSKSAGYLFGVTTSYGKADLEENLLELSRIRINRSDTLATFVKKVN